MVDRRITLLGMARENSSRCSGKMTRPFRGKDSLFDLYLRRLRLLGFHFYDVRLAIWPGEPILWRKAVDSGIPVIPRSAESVADGKVPIETVYDCLKQVSTPYVLFLNASVPFMPSTPVVEAMSAFIRTPEWKSLTAANLNCNWFWSEAGRCLTMSGDRPPDTQSAGSMRVATHAFHILDCQSVLKGKAFGFTFDDPHVWICGRPVENLDINTEDEFFIASSVAEALPCERVNEMWGM